MATRSAIAMKTPEGKIKAIYCHWDGYVDHNGKILLNDYSDIEKVKALIDLGDLSCLRSEIGEKHDFDAKYSDEPELPMTDNWCMAYHRDRGEEWSGTAPQTIDDAVAFVDCFDGSSCEYFYLFDGRDWLVSNGTKDSNGFPIFDFVEVEILKEIAHA